MQDWNVVVTVHEHGFAKACKLLETFGPIAKTGFFNVLVMKVADTEAFLDALQTEFDTDSALALILARVMPVSIVFFFQSPEEFEDQARKAAARLVPELAGRKFHVRMHRRGFKGHLGTQEEELFLDRFIVQRLADNGLSAEIDFDDPDVIIALETIGQRAGLSLWTRADIERYSCLKLD